MDSLKWFFLYPFVKSGLVCDPWESAITDIMEMEDKYGMRSTFFFIPFPNRSGFTKKGFPAHNNRAAMYDIKKYQKLLQLIELKGWEVGVHGIDAHLGVKEAIEEFKIMQELFPDKKEIGMRMHWLYQSDDLWKNLKEAGFYYDATFGTNEGVGFPEDKYKPFKKDGIWAIPLTFQDAALLDSCGMKLPIANSWPYIKKVLNIAKEKKAVVTVSWHSNVFGVYKYYGRLYERILQQAQNDGARGIRCIDICNEMESSGLLL
jgi:peptidoglycan/xylan/chitin deacetylase (PgdA/CDA1 family)